MIKRLIILGALALALGAGFRLSKTSAPSGVATASAATARPDVSVIPSGVSQRWEPVWTAPAPQLSAASISPDGSVVAWIDTAGAVRRVDAANGKTRWQTPALHGMNDVVVAPGGDVFVYSPMNRLNPKVRLLDRDRGAAKGAEYPLDGAVWSVAIAADGGNAFFGTGQGTVYTIPIRRTADAAFLHPTTWSAAGIPENVAVNAEGTLSVVSTWDTRVVSGWHPTLPAPDVAPAAGTGAAEIWHAILGDPTRDLTVTLSADGATAVGVSGKGRRGDDPRLEVWDATTGRVLWQEAYDGFGARAMVSADGRYIAVTYAETSEYKTGSVVERRLCLYTRDGTKVFGGKGGLYFAPELVAVSGDGSRITVRSGNSTLYTLDGHGTIRAKLTLPDDPKRRSPPAIRQCLATADGRYLLIVRGDGAISLYRAIAT